MSIEQYIQQITHDGKTLVDFLVDTLQGNTHDATVSHRLKSAEWLAKFGGFIPETTTIPTKNSAPSRLRVKSESKKPPVTEKQILHYDIARLIKKETQDGITCVNFLARVVQKEETKGENFTPASRIRATRELLNRGYGSVSYAGCRPRIPSGDAEELDSNLSKFIRRCTNDGIEIVYTLIDALENKTPEAISKGASPKPGRQNSAKRPKGFTASQRVWAACELMRRAYDIRTDHITPEDIQAYRNAQTPADADNADASAPVNTEKPAENNAATRATRRRQQRANHNAQTHANHNADANRETRVDSVPSAEKPAENNAATRATRRRQQRANHNAQTHANHSAHANRENRADSATVTTEKPANTDASAENTGSATANTEKRVDNADSAENPAGNSVSAPVTTETPAYSNGASRAARRRQQRAARKAQKRSPRHSDIAPDAQTPEDYQAELDAFIAFANANDIPYFILESEEPETAPSNAPNPANTIPDDP